MSLYDTPLHGHTRGVWEFVYTPFAALMFVPLAALHGAAFTWVGGLANLLMLTGSVWSALSVLGYRRDRRMLIVGPTAAGLLLLCEPIRETMAFGQVNMLLLLLVLADMALPDSSRAKGVLTSTVVSPYSWIHHWVWLAPLLIYLAHLANRHRSVPTVAGLLAVFLVCSGGMFILFGVHRESVFDFPNRGPFALFEHNAFIWLALVLFALTAVALRRNTPAESDGSA
ncbi:glycosyltransferase 87 family protein [Nocardia sp. NPDC059246]|uniref:glycosyltransferase 87 family protein n=1 Tax=unclassified Nocardia TaxID=2637762 RepID=UPI0036A8BE3B